MFLESLQKLCAKKLDDNSDEDDSQFFDGKRSTQNENEQEPKIFLLLNHPENRLVSTNLLQIQLNVYLLP